MDQFKKILIANDGTLDVSSARRLKILNVGLGNGSKLLTTGENIVKLAYFALIGIFGLGLLGPMQVIGGEKIILSAASDKASPSNNEGTVVNSMNAAAYTYVELENKGKRFWIAAPTTKVSVGDHISFVQSMVMRNFNSKTLNRTFESVIFVTSVKIEK